MPATVSYSADSLDHQRLHVNLPRQDTSQGLGYPAQTYQMSSPYGHQSQSVSNLPNGRFSLTNVSISPLKSLQDFSLKSLNVSSNQAAPAYVEASAPVDNIETAIDFVLALEHPCMTHIPYGDPKSNDPANHTMMASTPLVARAPNAPRINQQWTTSGAIIKELLNISLSINLDGEITPVEAWHRLHGHPEFWRLDQSQIERLKQKLSSAVRCCGYVFRFSGVFCRAVTVHKMLSIVHLARKRADRSRYSFGAVLDERVFWDALQRSLAAARSSRTR